MKIIIGGKKIPKQFKHTCKKCSCKFIVEENDYKRDTIKFLGEFISFTCPNCNGEIHVPEYKLMRWC